MSTPKRKLQTLPLELRPMARVTRVPLFEREIRERLSNAAVEILLGNAEVLAEGRRSDSPTAKHAFFGSIMITIDLSAVERELRDACTPDTAARVAKMMEADARVARRLRQIAEREATRLAGTQIRVHSADVRMRVDGARVFVDIDVEE